MLVEMGADTDICSILRLHEIREIVLFGFFLVGCVGVCCCCDFFSHVPPSAEGKGEQLVGRAGGGLSAQIIGTCNKWGVQRTNCFENSPSNG